MGFRIFKRKKALPEAAVAKTREVEREVSPGALIPRGFNVIDRYPIYEPNARILIVENPKTGEMRYIVDELKLTELERAVYERISETLKWELVPMQFTKQSDVVNYFVSNAQRVINKYRISLGEMPGISWSKILYYLERDIMGYGPLEPIMRDPNIEDISCNGVNIPIYVWHRRYESLPTNVVFKDEEELNNFIIKLAHKAGKHISTAYPILDAMLPENHRVAATFMREVSRGGPTFTIRKFREDPISIVDMINFGTLDPEVAAYLWLAMEHKLPVIIIGVTGAGKTTMLNALACMFRPTIKVVTIEDTPELRLPLENWVQLTSRPSYGFGPEKIGEISLFDLVKVSLRYRPDVIIVGEVRGEEAYVLFQAMATGHGGMTSLHAENVDTAVKRLTSPPMNIPKNYIPLVKIGIVVRRLSLRRGGVERVVRRVTEVTEILDYDRYVDVARWVPSDDTFIKEWEESANLRDIAVTMGMTFEELLQELNNRKELLIWMSENHIRSYSDVAKVVQKYYATGGL